MSLNTSNKDILLMYEFADYDGKIKPMIFRDPKKIITAYSTDQVIPALDEINSMISQGYYGAGFLSYESAPAFDNAYKVNKYGMLPLLWFGIYDTCDYTTNSEGMVNTYSQWRPSVTKEEYSKAISTIKEHIRNGDTYQVNYTLRLHSEWEGDSIGLFNRLKKAQSSNYCAYLNIGSHCIVSASPELFFHLKDNVIITKPMKGTIKRGRYYEEDRANADILFHSEKDRAENVMIVDLLRNDLGVIAETGSVKVTKLFTIEQYPTVHQMTSTVTAALPKDIGITEIFKALFPCGSITGAPKVSTMKIIANTESLPREVYCGAIGYITPEREAVFNVPIRTVMIEEASKRATYGVGGGITWDSTSKGEYEEVLAKSSLLNKEVIEFHILESLLLEKGEYFLFMEHLKRMESSASYFQYPFQAEAVIALLKDYALQRKETREKVRIFLSKSGDLKIDSQLAVPYKKQMEVILADHPIDNQNPFLFHKTTNRGIYDKFEQLKAGDIFDVLMWNEKEELTEFTRGNLVVELEDGLYTPPVDCGLLPGTFRGYLLEQNIIKERVVTKKDLQACKKLMFINSVRRWVDVRLK